MTTRCFVALLVVMLVLLEEHDEDHTMMRVFHCYSISVNVGHGHPQTMLRLTKITTSTQVWMINPLGQSAYPSSLSQSPSLITVALILLAHNTSIKMIRLLLLIALIAAASAKYGDGSNLPEDGDLRVGVKYRPEKCEEKT
jgi:hypothetical protein